MREAAAWVVREGTTNIVRHSKAACASFVFGAAGMSVCNDGAPGPVGEFSGLRGLEGRLDTVGARLQAEHRDDTFVLGVRWEQGS